MNSPRAVGHTGSTRTNQFQFLLFASAGICVKNALTKVSLAVPKAVCTHKIRVVG
eukprot:m.4778 g.4778  ORF g.4778 m.4778 type:complete len:55 (+) comp3768_c0_seq1:262-426(+)